MATSVYLFIQDEKGFLWLGTGQHGLFRYNGYEFQVGCMPLFTARTARWNVTEIAYHVGFNILSYFSKCFKEKFGKSPSDYAP